VVVIGTTNRLGDVDTAAVRTGRFDIKLAIFPPNCEERVAILRFHIGDVEGIGETDLAELARRMPLFTSSDLYAVVAWARRCAASRRVAEGEAAQDLCSGDLWEGLKQVGRSSLDLEDLERWRADLRRWEPEHPRLQGLIEEMKAVSRLGADDVSARPNVPLPDMEGRPQ
jgi:SpoVK/Ycf46/Vps4 family AAA+-type ATPase